MFTSAIITRRTNSDEPSVHQASNLGMDSNQTRKSHQPAKVPSFHTLLSHLLLLCFLLYMLIMDGHELMLICSSSIRVRENSTSYYLTSQDGNTHEAQQPSTFAAILGSSGMFSYSCTCTHNKR